MKRMTLALLLLLSLISSGCATQCTDVFNSPWWGILTWFGDDGLTQEEEDGWAEYERQRTAKPPINSAGAIPSPSPPPIRIMQVLA
jgi:hypothetical protein